MKSFHLSVAHSVRGVAQNKTYSTHVEITSCEDLKKAVQYDHVAGMFRNNHRSNDDFIEADCVIMDCDNDSSDAPDLWLTPHRLAQRLNDVEFACVYSRNHMKDKSNKTARPRFHVYFALSETVDKAATIAMIKAKLLVLVREFDGGAKDAARFIYGVERPDVELHEGSMCIDEFLTIEGIELPEKEAETKTKTTPRDSEAYSDAVPDTPDSEDSITVGERHSTLLKTAFDALSRYTESKAREIFDKACARCKPAKPIDEVSRIWKYAVEKTRAFKDSVKERQKKILTLRTVEQTLQELKISVRFNVITRELEVSDLPDNDHVPLAYFSLKGKARRKASADFLPPFLLTYFKEKNYSVNEAFITEAISVIASANPLNPIHDMLNATTWDGHDRIADLCNMLRICYVLTDEGVMQRTFLEKWLLQCVVMALNDEGDIGNEFALVLQGRQGIGKTNFFRRLAMRSEWFREGAVIDLRDKDSRIENTRKWIVEIGELDATIKKEQANLKSFISAHSDTYRIPYARKADTIERRTSFCATVNPDMVIRDDTGSRRYVIIHVDDIDRDFLYNVMTPDWCAQLWQQVYEEFYLAKGRNWYFLSTEEKAFSEKSNEQYTVPLEGEIELREILAWDIESKPLEAYAESWAWITLTTLKEQFTPIEKIDTRKLCKAIPRIVRSLGLNPDKFKRRVNGRTEYKLPPKRYYA